MSYATEYHGGALSSGLDRTILDFSTSINPLGPHPDVIQCVRESSGMIRDYPDMNAGRLEDELAIYTGMPSGMVVAGNGATEIIHNVCRIAQDGRVLVAGPAFGEYTAAARLCGLPVRIVNDMPRFIESIPGYGIVFVANPSNPAGRLLHSGVMMDVVRACCDAGAILVVDECFIEMTPGRNESIVGCAESYENLVVLRSMTKSFGMAGLRLGYAVSRMASRLRDFRIPWSINALAQEAGVEALRHPHHIQDGLRLVQDEVSYLCGTVMGSCRTDANYMVVSAPMGAHRLQRCLLDEHNILVRNCASFGMPRHIRVGVRTRKENKILADALRYTCRV